jgi:hypothetical protein
LAQEQWIEDFGMKQAERAKFCGESESDHEVGHGQESRFLFGRPDLLVERAALGAGSVIAAMVGVLFGFAAMTLIETSAEYGRAAREDAPHGPVMVGVELVSVGTGVVEPMLTKQVCEKQGHGSVVRAEWL